MTPKIIIKIFATCDVKLEYYVTKKFSVVLEYVRLYKNVSNYPSSLHVCLHLQNTGYSYTIACLQ